jgi:uncharacterized protein (DUF302 family)
MSNYGRRVVIDSGFEAVVGHVSRALREEGFHVIGRIDVRDHFWRDLGRDFRHYFLIQAWSPEWAVEALRHDLDLGTVLPVTIAVYELADGETAVVANEPFAPALETGELQRNSELGKIALAESERIARVFDRLQHDASRQSPDPKRRDAAQTSSST